MAFLFQLLVLWLFTAYFFVFDRTDLQSLKTIKQQTSSQQSTEELPPAQVMKNILLTEYQASAEGQKEWVLKAKKAMSDSYEKNWDVRDSKVMLYKNNTELVEIDAQKGLVNTKTRNLELSTNVVGHTRSGYTFKTQNLDYLSETEVFTSDSEIYFEAPGQQTQLYGQSMKGFLNQEIVEIKGPVECQQQVEGYKLAKIKSDFAKVRLDERQVEFESNLFIQMDDINITGQKAEFVYSDTDGELQSLIITGKVFVTSGERSASSERLEIRLNEDLFLFQGNPRFVSGDNVLVGNEIILYDKGKKVQILKGQVKSVAPKKLEN